MAKKATGTEHRARFKALTEQRARALGLRWRDVAERSGYSESLIRRVRNDFDTPISTEMAKALDRALGWAPGVRLILQGQDPVEAYPADPEPDRPAEGPALSDIDVLVYWSRRLDGHQFQLLTEHITAIRLAAYEEGRRAGAKNRSPSEG